MTSKSAVDLITSSDKDNSVTKNHVDGEFVLMREEAVASRCREV